MDRIFLRWESKSFATESEMMGFINESLIPDEQETAQFSYAAREKNPHRVRYRLAYERST